jgi:hypothetical protein
MGNYDRLGVTLYSRLEIGFFPVVGPTTEKRWEETIAATTDPLPSRVTVGQ